MKLQNNKNMEKPQLRYLVEIKETQRWDDRGKEYYTDSVKLPPILQYFDDITRTWYDVKTVTITKKQ